MIREIGEVGLKRRGEECQATRGTRREVGEMKQVTKKGGSRRRYIKI